MGSRFRLARHSLAAFASATPVPVISVAPTLVDGLGNAAPTNPIVGQRYFVGDGTWTNGPILVRAKTFLNGADSSLIDTGGADFWMPNDADAATGLTVKPKEVATNLTGDSLPSIGPVSGAVAQIALSGITPISTRTSGSTASPFTVSDQFPSALVFAGYIQRIQVSTDAAFGTIDQYDGYKVLTEEDLQAPFTPDWSGNSDPIPTVPYDNTRWALLTVYRRTRVEATSPLGTLFTTAWSNVVSNVDAAIPTTFWNGSSDTPASSAAYSRSVNNTVAARTSLASDRIVRANVGRSTLTQSFKVTPTGIGSVTCVVGVSPASQSTADWVGDVANGVGYEKTGKVYTNGSVALNSGVTYVSGDQITTILKNGKVYFQKNGVDITGMNSTAETGGIAVTGTVYPAASCGGTTGSPAFTLDGTLWP